LSHPSAPTAYPLPAAFSCQLSALSIQLSAFSSQRDGRQCHEETPSATWAAHAANQYQVAANLTYLTASNFDAKLDVYSRRGVTSPQPTVIYYEPDYLEVAAPSQLPRKHENTKPFSISDFS
jgi:hypothetical protein